MSNAAADTPPDHEGVDPRIERTHAAVVDAAATLLLEEGPDAITHGRVAAAANVSRTTVYKHYPERADLLHATVKGIGKSAPDPANLTGDLRTDLRMFIGLLATDLRDDGRSTLMATMMERALHDEAVAEVRNSMVAEFGDAFASVLKSAIQAGTIRADIDPFRALASLGGSLLFAKFLADRHVDDALLDAVIDDFVTTNAPR